MAVVLIGTLDTKGRELGFARDELRRAGVRTLVIDAGSLAPPTIEADIPRDEVFRRAGGSASLARERGDRGQAVAEAARGVAEVVRELDRAGEVEGVLAIGGSAGTVIGTAAMRALPFGRPKLMVSTLASGQVRPFVGGSDILMLHSVADVAGLNRLTRTVLSNAAHAMAGMIRRDGATATAPIDDRPVIGASMFGVTTPCVEHARACLEANGNEVIVFHATGVGGQAMEGLIRDGLIDGMLDLTTTELADELVGGVLSAGPDRLEAAGKKGIPQVVSLGALDMVNFGPRSTVPERFEGRTFHIHNEAVTLMRTTPEENSALGARIADVLGRSSGPVAVLVPLRGVSALDAPGRPFHDPKADAALFEALAIGLKASPQVRLVERDEHINDPAFAEAAASTLVELMSQISRFPRKAGS
jgi:uncharacterized protein (UPF0261 family)